MTSDRDTSERIEHALQRLGAESSVWVATGSAEGVPHLVPLSSAWDGTHVLVVTRSATPTVRNAESSGRARLALDSTDDVVIVDADVTITTVSEVGDDKMNDYVEQAGWDPRTASGSWSMLICSPNRMLAWNSISETSGRTIMSDGQWRSDS